MFWFVRFTLNRMAIFLFAMENKRLGSWLSCVSNLLHTRVLLCVTVAQSLILRHLFLFYYKFWQFLPCFCAPPLNIPFHLCLHSLPKIPSVFRTWRSCVLRTSRHELVGRLPSDCSRYCPYLCKKHLGYHFIFHVYLQQSCVLSVREAASA